MIPILGALFPVFGVVIIGFVLRRMKFPGDAFWPYSDRLTYFVLFPALLINKLSTANLARPELFSMMGILVLSIIVVSVLVWLVKPIVPSSNTSYTSVLQGSIRPNTYIGLAGASALLGADGLALLAVVVLYTCLPCSVSSYTLAAELGGDKNLVAAIITIQTLLAILTMPLLLEMTVL